MEHIKGLVDSQGFFVGSWEKDRESLHESLLRKGLSIAMRRCCASTAELKDSRASDEKLKLFEPFRRLELVTADYLRDCFGGVRHVGYAIVGVLIVSGIILLGISIYVAIEGRKRRNLWFAGFALAAALHSFGYAFKVTANSVEEALVYIRIAYLGISFLPTFGFLAALELAGKDRHLKKGTILSMIAFSAVTLAIVCTNSLHHLYYIDIVLTKANVLTIVHVVPGIWYKVFMTYVNLAFAAGIVIMARALAEAPVDLKPQYWVYFVSFLVPGVGNLVYLLGLSPYDADLAPFYLVFMSVLLLFGLNENQLFQVVSIAKSRVLDSMDDAVLIINRNNRIIDHNQSLTHIVAGNSDDYVGERLSDVFSSHPQVVDFVTNHANGQTNVALQDGSGRVYRVRVRTVQGRRKGAFVKCLTMSDMTREMNVMRDLKDLAHRDALTNIANRRALYCQAEDVLRRCGTGMAVSSIMLDIDDFKQVNDSYGHEAGDMVLKEVALLLKQSIRAQDILARYGGEEFVLIMPDTEVDAAFALAERLRKKIAGAEIFYNDQRIELTVSMGVAGEICSPDLQVDQLIKNADAALYEAKRSGRNKVALYRDCDG